MKFLPCVFLALILSPVALAQNVGAEFFAVDVDTNFGFALNDGARLDHNSSGVDVRPAGYPGCLQLARRCVPPDRGAHRPGGVDLAALGAVLCDLVHLPRACKRGVVNVRLEAVSGIANPRIAHNHRSGDLR